MFMETGPLLLRVWVGEGVGGWLVVGEGEGEGGTERAPVLLVSTCRFVKKTMTTHVRVHTTVTNHCSCSWIVYLPGHLLRVGVNGWVGGWVCADVWRGGVCGWVGDIHTHAFKSTRIQTRARAPTRIHPLPLPLFPHYHYGPLP